MRSISLDNKVVFVTGGTGTIGSKVVTELLSRGAYVCVYSRDQNKQFTMDHKLASNRVFYRNGDVTDQKALFRLISGQDYVIHCAASKHLPLCEQNVDSAIKVNVEGTRTLLEVCLQQGVKRFILLSTDKAVSPTSVMGSTKFLAERLTLEFSEYFPCSIIRLGNVFASNGSVVPTFADRIKNKLPLLVNHPSASRYFLTQKQAGEFIVDRLLDMEGGEIFVKKMKFMTIKQLAECMAPLGYPINEGKLTNGEKLKETLITQTETGRAWDMGDYIKVADGDHGKRIDFNSSKVEQFKDKEIIEMLKEIK